MKYWGFSRESENETLEQKAQEFKAKMRRLKSSSQVEQAVREFMREYLAIGDDPTDTVIRDKVWMFLLKNTKRFGRDME